jgi:hypothetical protein
MILAPAASLGITSHVTVVDGGAAGTEIGQTARRVGADVIVLATHGRGGLGRALLGSVAESVIRERDRPVHVVQRRKPTRPGRPGRQLSLSLRFCADDQIDAGGPPPQERFERAKVSLVQLPLNFLVATLGEARELASLRVVVRVGLLSRDYRSASVGPELHGYYQPGRVALSRLKGERDEREPNETIGIGPKALATEAKAFHVSDSDRAKAVRTLVKAELVGRSERKVRVEAYAALSAALVLEDFVISDCHPHALQIRRRHRFGFDAGLDEGVHGFP